MVFNFMASQPRDHSFPRSVHIDSNPLQFFNGDLQGDYFRVCVSFGLNIDQKCGRFVWGCCSLKIKGNQFLEMGVFYCAHHVTVSTDSLIHSMNSSRHPSKTTYNSNVKKLESSTVMSYYLYGYIVHSGWSEYLNVEVH